MREVVCILRTAPAATQAKVRRSQATCSGSGGRTKGRVVQSSRIGGVGIDAGGVHFGENLEQSQQADLTSRSRGQHTSLNGGNTSPRFRDEELEDMIPRVYLLPSEWNWGFSNATIRSDQVCKGDCRKRRHKLRSQLEDELYDPNDIKRRAAQRITGDRLYYFTLAIWRRNPQKKG